MMQANQRRSLPLIEVAMHRVANLLVELVDTISLSMNPLTHGVGAIGAIFSLFDNKKDFVHDASLACPFWQPMQALA